MIRRIIIPRSNARSPCRVAGASRDRLLRSNMIMPRKRSMLMPLNMVSIMLVCLPVVFFGVWLLCLVLF